MHFGVTLPSPSVLLSLCHILQCNDLNLLQGFEPCQLCGAFLTNFHWHDIGTSPVAHQDLAVYDKSMDGITVKGSCRVLSQTFAFEVFPC